MIAVTKNVFIGHVQEWTQVNNELSGPSSLSVSCTCMCHKKTGNETMQETANIKNNMSFMVSHGLTANPYAMLNCKLTNQVVQNLVNMNIP